MVIATAHCRRRQPKNHAAAGYDRPARRRCRRWSNGRTPPPKRIASARMSAFHLRDFRIRCIVVPGAAAISPPPPIIFSQVAASRFRGAPPPPPPVIFASWRPRHIFWRTTIFTNGSDEICQLAHFYIAITIV
jgi:hypothetical protein